MSNCLFAYPDRTLAATLTGGSWISTLPLANLKNQALAAVARSTDTAATSTQFSLDLGQSRDIRLLALYGHNCTTSATIRVRLYADAAKTVLVHDTGTIPVIPIWYPPQSLPWEHPSFWNGAATSEDLDGATLAWWHVLPSTVIARAAMWEVIDTTNPDGYVQAARAWCGPAWEPPSGVGLAFGAAMAIEDNTGVEQSLGGPEFFDILPQRRVHTFSLEGSLTPEVALSWVTEMQRRLGVAGELFFVFDSSDIYETLRRQSFIGRMRKLSPLEYPDYNRRSAAYEIQEVL